MLCEQPFEKYRAGDARCIESITRVQTKALEFHHSEILQNPGPTLWRQVVFPLPRVYFTVYYLAGVTIEIYMYNDGKTVYVRICCCS